MPLIDHIDPMFSYYYHHHSVDDHQDDLELTLPDVVLHAA